MGKDYLIDSNSLLDYLALSLPDSGHVFMRELIASSFNVSVISRIELLGHVSATQNLYDFLDLAVTFPLSEDVADRTIAIRKLKKIKLPDAIIAATALVHNLIIITRNISDFKNIEGLEYLNPHEVE